MTTGLCPAGFFVLRTPYLPADTVLDMDRQAAGTPTPSRRDEDARALLMQLAGRDDVREALRLASPDFADRVELWRTGVAPKSAGLERSLLAYLLRMSTRPTPFGLFAGYSIGLVSEDAREPTSLAVPAACEYRRHVTLDVAVLGQITERLSTRPVARSWVRYVPNTTLYIAPEQVRYIDSRSTGTGRTQHLVGAAWSPALQALVSRAVEGATLGDLAAAVQAARPDTANDEVYDFVEEAIAAQLVVPDLGPLPTSGDPLQGLIDEFQDPSVSDARDALVGVRADLEVLNRTAPGQNRDAYYRVESAVLDLEHGADRARLFRVNLSKPTARVTLPRPVLDEVARGVELLRDIGGTGRPDVLAEFRAAFRRRYGDGQRVPLCEAIDDDAGVGFAPWSRAPRAATPLLEGLEPLPVAAPHAAFGERDALLLEWLIKAAGDAASEIALGPAEIGALRRVSGPNRTWLPDSLAVSASILARDSQAIDAGDYRVLISALSGPSAASMLGRFCRGDEELADHVRRHLRAEEAMQPDAVFAEIVHLPEDRVADVMVRPRLRAHEIPYLARSSVPRLFQLDAADLEVSVTGDRVLITSRRLGKEVVPRLSAAHNYAHAGNLPLYQFLCALQDQGVATGLGFSFGALSSAPHLPRIAAGRLILSPEQWQLSADVVAGVTRSARVDAHAAVAQLRADLGLPRTVAVVSDGRALPLDLDQPSCAQLLVHSLRGRSSVTLLEAFVDRRGLPAAGPEGPFMHELVIPFLRTAKRPRRLEGLGKLSPASRVQRVRPPGTEWLYAKLYCGPSSGNAVLERVVAPLIDNGTEPLVDRWFFVRAADPHWHLRLRIHGDPGYLLSTVEPFLLSLTEPLFASGLVWRTQLDTYERELDRYGGLVGMGVSEEIFCLDSQAAMELILGSTRDPASVDSWQFALLGMDCMLADLDLSVADRLMVVTKLHDAVAAELAAGPSLSHQLGPRFRGRRADLEHWLMDGPDEINASWMAEARRVFDARSAKMGALNRRLQDLDHAGQLMATRAELATSYLHMHANRMLSSSINAQELVLYDVLSRFYRSRMARIQRGSSGDLENHELFVTPSDL